MKVTAMYELKRYPYHYIIDKGGNLYRVLSGILRNLKEADLERVENYLILGPENEVSDYLYKFYGLQKER